ncbi:hypothetical protein [Burkholderia cenocepacia]|uniref:hypothetical protein n=1 Tax=Burkholderia cenocepacia TaxID=95486 RepID=UPI002AAF5701|nr:hypothetical protein [Burkholderia cenocepacia]
MEFNAANIQEIIRNAIAANAKVSGWPEKYVEMVQDQISHAAKNAGEYVERRMQEVKDNQFSAEKVQEIIKGAIAEKCLRYEWPKEKVKVAIREVNKHIPFVLEAVNK